LAIPPAVSPIWWVSVVSANGLHEQLETRKLRNLRFVGSSTIQQGGAGASITTTYSVKAVEDLDKLVAVFESRLGELRLDEAKERAARTQVATIKVQLADHPDPVIVNHAGRTLRNITEGVIGSLVATAAEPGIWHWVQGIMALLGHNTGSLRSSSALVSM
jgi:hypothetical protein